MGLDAYGITVDTRKPEYLFALPNGDLIYVSADKWPYSYESFRLYVGPPGALKYSPQSEQGVSRYRDGGTTYVNTEAGVLYSPTCFDEEARSTWTPLGDTLLELTKIDPKRVTIVENLGLAEVRILGLVANHSVNYGYLVNDYQI